MKLIAHTKVTDRVMRLLSSYILSVSLNISPKTKRKHLNITVVQDVNIPEALCQWITKLSHRAYKQCKFLSDNRPIFIETIDIGALQMRCKDSSALFTVELT